MVVELIIIAGMLVIATVGASVLFYLYSSQTTRMNEATFRNMREQHESAMRHLKANSLEEKLRLDSQERQALAVEEHNAKVLSEPPEAREISDNEKFLKDLIRNGSAKNPKGDEFTLT